MAVKAFRREANATAVTAVRSGPIIMIGNMGRTAVADMNATMETSGATGGRNARKVRRTEPNARAGESVRSMIAERAVAETITVVAARIRATVSEENAMSRNGNKI